ncbi:MAG: TRAP transporter substrate-binding protein DctP [Proteobacteria bacterium]|nr:TRAP transporter substrate-binding protein DctP [Pseudomonadota bacterium]
MIRGIRSAAVLAAFGWGIGAAAAEEVTLRAVNAFAEGTTFAKPFERMIEKINQEGKGQLKITYVGGPRAMPPFEIGNALRNKVVDLTSVTGAFYGNLMPEADAFKLMTRTMAEIRGAGGMALIEKLHNDKLNAHVLGRFGYGIPFHIYLTKPVTKYDLTGLKIRVTPIYKDLVEALGGTGVTTAPGEVYTALERGVVDGYGWPALGIFDLGWHEKTKYRLDPGYYQVELLMMINLDSWKRLDAAQQKLLSDAALWVESLDSEWPAAIAAERERQGKAGIQALEFGAAQAKTFVQTAYDVGWKSVIAKNPEVGAQLRQAISK